MGRRNFTISAPLLPARRRLLVRLSDGLDEEGEGGNQDGRVFFESVAARLYGFELLADARGAWSGRKPGRPVIHERAQLVPCAGGSGSFCGRRHTPCFHLT